jgi:hypothetical protein
MTWGLTVRTSVRWVLFACGSVACGAAPTPSASSTPTPTPSHPQPEALAIARSAHACDAAGAAAPACALLARFEAGHAPAAPPRGQSYFGGSYCVGEETTEILETVRFFPLPTEAASWSMFPVDGPAAPHVDALRVGLASPTFETDVFAEDDWRMARALESLRTHGRTLRPASPSPVAWEDSRDVRVATRETWGSVSMRAEGDRLLIIEVMPTTPPTTCVGVLEPFQSFDVDTDPVVSCLSQLTRPPTANSADFDTCEDNHTYGIRCEGAHCTCLRDGATSAEIDVEAGQSMADAMRYGCGFPTMPSG